MDSFCNDDPDREQKRLLGQVSSSQIGCFWRHVPDREFEGKMIIFLIGNDQRPADLADIAEWTVAYNAAVQANRNFVSHHAVSVLEVPDGNTMAMPYTSVPLPPVAQPTIANLGTIAMPYTSVPPIPHFESEPSQDRWDNLA